MRNADTITKRSVRVLTPAELRAELEARSLARPPRRRPRRLARGRLSLLLASLATGLLAAGVFADGGSLNVEVANRQGYAAAKTTDGAIVEYIGDQNTSFGAAGTGIFNSFVRIQADGSEQGYNTNGTLEFDTKSGTWTHAIKVSEIPVVPCASADGNQTTPGLCWELFSDINENNNTPKLSLNDVEIYFTTNANLTGYPFAGPAPNVATKVYDFSGEIKINDVNQGSGRGDLRYLVPIGGISIPANCNFGNSACATYFVLYTRWGTSSGYTTDGGFEEWKVKQYPFLTVSKTAETSFTRTFNWEIAKSVAPDSWDLFTGDTGTSEYTVTVTKTGFTDSDWAVSGQISVHNPAPIAATLTGVTDEVSGVGPASVDCGVTFPYSLAAGGTLTCSYSLDLPNADSRTNTATATLQNYDYDEHGVGTASGTTDFTGSAAVTFASATVTEVDETITVTDTFAGTLGTVTYGVDTLPKTFTYPRTFGPFGTDACGEHDFPNTASFTTNDTATTGESSWNVHITIPCPEGCTLTQGHWKTHSIHGPAKPADPTWDLLPSGADTLFFSSGQTWYQVFWTSPKGGNAYYILAHQYMAAKLNILAGAASTPSVDAAIAWAESFFGTYSPTNPLPKTVRQQAIAAAGVLGQYNEGLIGPGHCSEDSLARAAGG